MLRLDPAHPPLWRTPDTLQFGVDGRAVLADPLPWQERWLTALQAGAAESELMDVAERFGVPSVTARRFLESLSPVLRTAGDDPAPVTVVLETPADLPDPVMRSMRVAFGDAGVVVTDRRAVAHPDRRRAHTDTDTDADADAGAAGRPVTVVVASHLVDPRRVAALMSADDPHLPIVLRHDRIEVGPLVRPGRTACLACLAAHQRDRDPAWPLVIAQLLGRPSPDVAASRAAEAALVAARLVSDVRADAWPKRMRSVTLTADPLHRQTRWHRPHAACGCRSPEGNATAASREARAPS
jgi:hypothetical protein